MRIIIKGPDLETPVLDQLDDRELAQAMQEKSKHEFMDWDRKLAERNGHIVAFNSFMSENAKQWGYAPGINTGNGQMESSMSLSLFLALSGPDGPFKDDPDWWKDDKKFYKWLREHPWHDARKGKHKSQGANFSGGKPC